MHCRQLSAVANGRPSCSAQQTVRSIRRTVTNARALEQAGDLRPSTECPLVKPELDPSLTDQLDFRVGAVLAAEALSIEVEQRRGDQVRMRKSKLLKLEVDIGTEIREIVADVYQVLDEESAVGKKLIVLANVPPMEVHGHRSHGRLLLGENYDATPMPRSMKNIFPGPGRLPAGSTLSCV